MKILLISSDVPVPSSMPGSPRSFCLFRHIARRHEIHLATFIRSPERDEALLASREYSSVFQTITVLPNPQTTSFWGRQRHRLAQAPYFFSRYRSPGEFRLIQNRIEKLIQQEKPDLVFADGLSAAQYIVDFDTLPRVVDAVDAISLAFRRLGAYADSPVERLRLFLGSLGLRRFEVATARRVDVYLVSSPIDQGVLTGYHPDMKVHCIPNGVDTEYFSPEDVSSDDKTIVFTGVMNYGPNADAARFLCTEILPRVRDVIPEVVVDLVGSDPPGDVRTLAGNGLRVTGTVPDVRPFVHRATVYVSPLRFGTGVKNKILAALAMGKAVVASPESCAGLEVTPGEHLLVADTPEEFAGHIVKLLTDPSQRRQLGTSGRNLVLERYGWDFVGEQLEELLERVVCGRGKLQPLQEESPCGSTRDARKSVV